MGVSESKSTTDGIEDSLYKTSLLPEEVITKQTRSECVETIKGQHEDRSVWHVVLVPYEKQAILEQNKNELLIRIDDFGRNVQYRNKAGQIRQASGYGIEPPERLLEWIYENYDPRAIGESTSLVYIGDDIRLCIIQRIIPEQPLGICLHYHRHERFHYIKLCDDDTSRLAIRAGIKSFDRIIEYNGVNVEEDSAEDLQKKINDISNQLVQLLVCSPATYEYYRKNEKHLHSGLDTVKRRKARQTGENVQDNYGIVPSYDSAAHITLINTEPAFDSDDLHTLQAPDVTQFVTATEPITADIVDNKKNENRAIIAYQRLSLFQQLASIIMNNQQNVEHDIQTDRPKCHGCGLPYIYDDRYRCLECQSYDLCGRCFDQRRETLHHTSQHAMVHFSDHNEIFGESVVDVDTSVTLCNLKKKYAKEEHPHIECDNCKMMPIKGLRFKCDVCHDYDLCVNCMEQRVHDQTHPLLAIGKSQCSEIPLHDIELCDELGRGGFGTVYKGKWLSKDRIVACKVINGTTEHAHREKSFHKELAAYAEVSSPYILKPHGYNIQQLADGARRCMLVLEYMARGSLTSVLRRKEKISLRCKVEMACQIASGMRKLHGHRMIHRDIRPDNILVTHDYVAKISDMGIARVWLPDINLTIVGCQAFMPMEFYTGRYNQSLDIFTFGLTINQLFTEKIHLFDTVTRRINLATQSPVFADLIARCIHNDPDQRPTAIEVETTLRMYRQAIERYIRENNMKYANVSLEEKNATFIHVYRTVHPEIDEMLKNKFPSARHSGELTDMINNQSEFLRFLGLLKPSENH